MFGTMGVGLGLTRVADRIVGAVEPPPVVTSFDAAEVQALVGPWLTPAQMTTVGGAYATFDSAFPAAGDALWSSQGASVFAAGPLGGNSGGNYYDRVKVWYVAWARFGTAAYLTRARAQAAEFVEWVVGTTYDTNYGNFGNNTGAAFLWANSEGLTLYHKDMVAQGNTAEATRTLNALGRIAGVFNNAYVLNDMGAMDARTKGYFLKALYWASLLNAPSVFWNTSPGGYEVGTANYHGSTNWTARLQSALTNVLATRNVGTGSFPDGNGKHKPFMIGLLHDALIKLYDAGVPNTSGIPAVIKGSIDHLWTNFVRTSDHAILYTDDTADDGYSTGHTPELNLMISPAFGWYGDYLRDTGGAGAATYKDRHDALFTAGIEGAYLAGGKQFNQQYSVGFRGPGWLNGIAGTPVAPAGVTWNPTGKSAATTLSADKLTASYGYDEGGVKGTAAISGKKVFRIRCIAGPGVGAGIKTTGAEQVYGSPQIAVQHGDGSIYLNGSYAGEFGKVFLNGDFANVWVDTVAGKVWITPNNTIPDVTSGGVTMPAGTYHPWARLTASGAQALLDPTGSTWTGGALPSGYTWLG